LERGVNTGNNNKDHNLYLIHQIWKRKCLEGGAAAGEENRGNPITGSLLKRN